MGIYIYSSVRFIVTVLGLVGGVPGEETARVADSSDIIYISIQMPASALQAASRLYQLFLFRRVDLTAE